MSHWMTSGRNRLKAKQNRSFSQRAQQRASLGAVDALLVPPGAARPIDLAENHPRRRRRSNGCSFSNPNNPLAQRAVVARRDPSPHELEQEALLHQHRQPGQTTGTENYRRIRNSRPRDGRLYIHRNGTKHPLQTYPSRSNSLHRPQGGAPPAGGSYAYRQDTRGEPSPAPPFAGRAAPTQAFQQGGRYSQSTPGFAMGQGQPRVHPQEARDDFYPQEHEYEMTSYGDGGMPLYESQQPAVYSLQGRYEQQPPQQTDRLERNWGPPLANFPSGATPQGFGGIEYGSGSVASHSLQQQQRPSGIAERFAAASGANGFEAPFQLDTGGGTNGDFGAGGVEPRAGAPPFQSQQRDVGSDPFFGGDNGMQTQTQMSAPASSTFGRAPGIDRFRNPAVSGGGSGQQASGISRFQQAGFKKPSTGTGGISRFQGATSQHGQTQTESVVLLEDDSKKRARGEDWLQLPTSPSRPLGDATQSVNDFHAPQFHAPTAAPTRAPMEGRDWIASPPMNPYAKKSRGVQRSEPEAYKPSFQPNPSSTGIVEDFADKENMPSAFPSTRTAEFNTPSTLRFFNQSVEVTLKGARLERPREAVAAVSTQHSHGATQDSDTLDDVDMSGMTSLWGFART